MSTELEFDQGFHLRGTPIWMDAETPRALCFVSSGRQRTLPRHGRILATAATARFCRIRAGQNLSLIAPFNRPFALGGARLELIPSGSMLGAAQLCVEHEDERVVYAGCLGPLAGLATAHAPQLKRCDVLAMHVPSPPVATVAQAREGRQALLDRLDACRSEGDTPVVLVEPLGLAQEIIAWCQAQGMRVRAHRSIAEYTRDYRKLDVLAASGLEPVARLRDDDDGRETDVVVFPRLLAGSPLLARLRRPRLFVPLGREDDEPELGGADKVCGVTASASLEELLVYGEACGARTLYLSGDGASVVAAAMREVGQRVTELRTPGQRNLFPDFTPSEQPPGSAPTLWLDKGHGPPKR